MFFSASFIYFFLPITILLSFKILICIQHFFFLQKSYTVKEVFIRVVFSFRKSYLLGIYFFQIFSSRHCLNRHFFLTKSWRQNVYTNIAKNVCFSFLGSTNNSFIWDIKKKRVLTSHRTLSIKYILKRTRTISACDCVGYIRNIMSPRRFMARKTLTTDRVDFETQTNKRHMVFNRFFFFSHTLIH